jgi:phosphoglucosamine mutase
MSNSGLEHFLAEHEIKLSRTKVGDRYVMERMRENGYLLGGEQAGHIIILDGDLTTGDGIYVGLLVASIVARNKRNGGPTLHELASRIPRYPQVIASAHLSSRVDLDSVGGLADLQRATLESFDNKGRVNVRFSGTEPNLLRAMVEGGPHTSMEEVIERAIAICSLVAAATHTLEPRIDIVDCVTGAPIAR